MADFTYVATWAGTVYVAFAIDVFSRKIVGWRARMSKETDLVLDAIDMGLRHRNYRSADGDSQLIHHSDAGSQGGFNWSSQHLDRGGVSGQASGVDEGVDGPSVDEVAWGAVASAGD